MYGFIHCCLQDLVVKKFGEETWQTIIKEAGVNLEGGEYIIHRIYSDAETMSLVTTTQRLSGIPLNDLLETFGDHFYYYCVESGYDRILRILGRTLREFLCNLDALHDHLAAIYPGMNAPSFRTTEREDGGIDLHYYSNRKGLGHIVVGIMKTIAKECLNSEIDIRIDRAESANHTVFAVYEKKTMLSPSISMSFVPSTNRGTQKSTLSTFKTLLKRKKHFMTVRSFSEAFPFHIIFDRNLKIRQCGMSIQRYGHVHGYSSKRRKKKMTYSSFNDSFRLIRPKMNFTFESVLDHINTVFIVTSKHRLEMLKRHSSVPSSPCDDSKTKSRVHQGILTATASTTSLCAASTLMSKQQQVTQELRLKGQMIYLPQTDCILFLCSPRVNSLEELERRGLFLSDIPLHDATREVILTNKEHYEDRKLVKKVEDSNNDLKILQSKLVYNKQITDDLLHELLPPTVVSQLRLNQPVLAESYDLVTILFSDLVGFTSLCSNESVVPMDIIKLLNKLYTMFDEISNMYSIYKVETIGDAYMAVCGIPNFFEDHAERVAKMGMDMLDSVKNVTSPVDSHPVRIRVGLHSGSCMAGVVGKKTPRYCLFGRTVTIANKMESGSSPGRVNVSVDTKKYLNPDHWNFELNTNPNPVDCFFLEKNKANLKRDGCHSIVLENLLTAETHLKAESPSSERKQYPYNDGDDNNNNYDDYDDVEKELNILQPLQQITDVKENMDFKNNTNCFNRDSNIIPATENTNNNNNKNNNSNNIHTNITIDNVSTRSTITESAESKDLSALRIDNGTSKITFANCYNQDNSIPQGIHPSPSLLNSDSPAYFTAVANRRKAVAVPYGCPFSRRTNPTS